MNVTELLIGFGETSLAVAILIAVVLVIRRPFARIFGARAAYVLWLAPLARLFLPELKILPAKALEEFVYVTATVAGASQIQPVEASIDWFAIAAGAALFLWIAVAFSMIAMHLGRHRRVIRDALANSIPAGRALQGEARSVARNLGLRRAPMVRCFADENGPLVMGVFRPVVFLPASFESEYSASERRLALAHEFAHIARGDIPATLAGAVMQAAQWPNPLVHFAHRAFRTDQEAACDAYVLARCGGAKAAGDYASAILKSVRRTKPAYGLSLGHPLKERLMLLKNSRTSLSRRLLGGLGAAALITAGLAATADYGYAAADEDNDVDVDVETKVIKEKRVLVFSGAEDEVVYDDVVVGDRVRVMQFSDGDGEGEHRVIRLNGHGPDHELGMMKFSGDGDDVSWTGAGCISSEDEGEPVMLEYKEETGDDDNKSVYHTIICLTGDEAKPENRAAALEKAIENLEKQAKEEEARRKKMIESLKKQAKELEKQK